ncbi:MAG: hypothetical protein ACHQ1G_06310, partial [Planctomycetota bacterium]
PPWASSALLGVRIEGDGTVFLDDVSLVKEAGAARVEEVKQNEFRVAVTDGRVVDVFHSDAAILVNGRPFARDAQGRELDAPGLAVKVASLDGEHVLLTVEGAPDGAAAAGVVLREWNSCLARGFRAFMPEAKEKKFHPSFPDEGVLALAEVGKLLLDSSGRNFAVLPTEGGRLDAEARMEGKVRSVALFGPVADGRFAFRLKVDLKGENQQATQRIADALSLDTQGLWGDFLVAAKQALAEFPFANRASREQLQKRIQEVNEDYEKRRASIDRLREEYKAFKDAEDLSAAAAQLAELEKKFQLKPGEGPRGQYLQEAKTEVARLDHAAREEWQTKAAEHTMIQAEFVDLPDGRISSAALQFFYVAVFLPDSQQAGKAREEMGKHPDVIAVLEKLGFKRRP